MNLFNSTGNFSNFPFLTFSTDAPIIFLVFSNLPKYIMSFGIVGNVISIFIFYRPCFDRKTNSAKLYAFLCCLSLILIVFNMATRNMDNFFQLKFYLPLYSQYFIDITLLQYWSWIQVLITFDRFIGVFYPIKGVRIMGKNWVLYSIIFGMLVFIIGINSPYFIRCSFYMVGNMTFTANGMICDDVALLTGIVRNLMQFIIPYLLMVTIDLKVIVRFMRLKKVVVVGERQSNLYSKSLIFSRKTILIDFIYLIFYLPLAIFNAFSLYLSIHRTKMNIFLLYAYMSQILDIFPYIYPSLLFLVFVCFNRIFRSEFIVIAIKCFNEIKNNLF